MKRPLASRIGRALAELQGRPAPAAAVAARLAALASPAAQERSPGAPSAIALRAAELRHARRLRESTYKGAEASRLVLDWVTSCLRPDDEIRTDLRRLRGRARELRRNSPLIRQYLHLLSTNVVGPRGALLQAQVRDGRGELDRRTNDMIEAAWTAWAESRVTVDRRLTFLDLQHLCLETVACDGESFVRKFLGFDSPYGFALQVIDADLVDENYNRERGREGNEIRLGVEVDELSAPVAYWPYRDPRSPFATAAGRYRVDAAEILHLYRSERANQTRGVTWLHSVMFNLKMLAGYVEAELVAARIAAAKMGFVQAKEGAIAGEATEETGENGSKLSFEANPGTIEQLPAGWEFNGWDPQHPSTAFPDFLKANMRDVASGLGVSYNALANDLEGVNYSSMRSGLLLERELWRKLQQWWIVTFLRPVYVAWLEMALLTGQLALDSRDFRRYAAHRWVPRGWAWVDPLKDVQAARLAISDGMGSRSDFLAEQGKDLEETLEQLAAEQKLIESYGLKLAAPAEVKDDSPASDEEEEKKNGNGRSRRLSGSRLLI